MAIASSSSVAHTLTGSNWIGESVMKLLVMIHAMNHRKVIWCPRTVAPPDACPALRASVPTTELVARGGLRGDRGAAARIPKWRAGGTG